MIRQTCQRCGHSFGGQISPAYERDQVELSIFLGEWSRNYILCEPCAARFEERLASLMEHSVSELKVVPWCDECDMPKYACICKTLASIDA